MNFDLKIVEQNPSWPWSWRKLSSHEDLNIDFVEKFIYKPWDWDVLLCNPIITLNFIEKYINSEEAKHWDHGILSLNPHINLEFFEKYNKVLNFDYVALSENSNLIEEFKNVYISEKDCNLEKVKLEFFIKYVHTVEDWDNLEIETDSYFDFEFLKRYPDKPWNYKNLSYAEVIDYDLLIEIFEKVDFKLSDSRNFLDLSYLSMLDTLPLKFITYIFEKGLDKFYDWKYLSENPNITLEFVKTYPNKPWNLEKLLKNVF